MFTLQIPLTAANVAALKSDLGNSLAGVKSSHRCEALGRGLGFGTYAALLAASRDQNPALVSVDGPSFSIYLSDHGFDVTSRPFYLAVGRASVRAVLEDEPRLTLHGIGVGRPKRKDDGKWETPREHYARVVQSREEYVSDSGVEEFLAALAFVERITPTKTVRPNTGSYGLKHIAEKYACTYPDGSDLGPRYISNGALIGAAIHAGFKYKTFTDELGYDSLNVTFNMSKPALDDLDFEIRPDGARAQERRLRAERQQDWPYGVAI